MKPDTTQIVDGLIGFARTRTKGKIGHIGWSFGGYFSAATGLQHKVDAAIVIGGPTSSLTFSEHNARNLICGMDDIFGNAVGFHFKPDIAALVAALEPFALDDLPRTSANAPMLVINGDHDPYVPSGDTTIFDGHRDTTDVLIPEGTHCAFNKLDLVLPLVSEWAAGTLGAER
jgi:esterase FrsA